MSQIKFSKCNCCIQRGKFDVKNIPLDCVATWKLIQTGYTIGIFQLEKYLGQEWSRKAKPGNIQELADLISIIRPGVLEAGLADQYIKNKFGQTKPKYLHDSLEPILSKTYGILVYQEQILRIAQELAGFSLEESDSLRKAVGKKIPELMSEIKTKFLDGCKKKNIVNEQIAQEIFDWIEKSQRYSFNASHAISYAMLGYQTAYLKTHFPHEFYCSYLTFSKYKGDTKEEIHKLIQDARLFGVNIFPPDIRRRNINFKIIEKPYGIVFGLGHIKGVGQSAIKKILEKDSNDFSTWAKFLSSVPELHRDVGISLIKSGSCDCYGIDRIRMIQELEIILGSTGRDENGQKTDIKGLTKKEKEFFFRELESGKNSLDILQYMSTDPGQKNQKLKNLSKSDLVLLGQKYNHDVDLSKFRKNELITLIKEAGYKEFESPCANEARRKIMANKAIELNQNLKDSNLAKAEAEKYFLGISLSCSAADDIDDCGTHTCLDIAKELNETPITSRVIIEYIRHTKTKKGKNPGSPMCFLTFSDSTYAVEKAVVFPDSYKRIKNLCQENLICLIFGHKKNGSFIVQDIKKLI